MRIFIASLATVALAFSAGAAIAQDSGSAALPPTDRSFAGVDTDRNGLVGWPEFSLVFPDMTEEQFKMADANGDGSLSQDEFDSLQLATGSVQTLGPAPAEIVPGGDSLTHVDPD